MRKTTKSTMENLALISQVGIMMIVPVVFGVFAGNFLDVKFNTSPIFLIIMIILGVGSAFRNLMHLAATKSKEYKNDYSARTQVENFTKDKEMSSPSKKQSHLSSDKKLDMEMLYEEEAKADEAEIKKMKE